MNENPSNEFKPVTIPWVRRCARCGQDHENLVFKKLAHPHGTYTHWASCPTGGEPILLKFTKDAPQLLLSGMDRIQKERERQKEVKGWTPGHDDGHASGELEAAADCYFGASALLAEEPLVCIHSMDGWPWGAEWWKPGQCPERCLEKAGALYLAEALRLQRRDEGNDLMQVERLNRRVADCASLIDFLFAKRLDKVKVVRLNDCEWWMAYSLEEAIADYLREIHAITLEAPVSLERLLEAGEDYLDEPAEVGAGDLDEKRIWNSESAKRMDVENWRCECGAVPDMGGDFRWDGHSWQHHHGPQLGHVPMRCVSDLTFREALAVFLSNGDKCPGMFWATDP